MVETQIGRPGPIGSEAAAGAHAIATTCERAFSLGGSEDASLDSDGGAGALEGLLGLLCGLLGDLLENSLGGRLDEVLGLLEAEARERADLLDDVDLLLAGGLEDDVELVLLGGFLTRVAATGDGGCGGGNRSGCGHTEGLLELLHELAELQEGHLLEGVEQLVGAELRHGGVPFSDVRRQPRLVMCDCAAPGGQASVLCELSGASVLVSSAAGASSDATSSAGASVDSAPSVGASPAAESSMASSAGATGTPAPPLRIDGSCSAFASRAPTSRAAWASGALSR